MRLRVLTFLHSFALGGVEKRVFQMWPLLRDAGLDLPIVMGRNTGEMRGAAPDLDYHFLDTKGDRTAWFETLWMIMRLPAMIRRSQPNVLYCAGNTYAIVAVMMALLLGRDCPPIVIKISNDLERRDMIWPVRGVYHWWVRYQMRYFAAIVAMAPPAVAEISRIGAVPLSRISVVPNPCITSAEMAALVAAGARRKRSQGIRFLSVARLTAQKNQALMIRAFAAIAEPHDQLMIRGEGPLRPALEALVQQLGLSGQVFMPGHTDALADAYEDADVFVLSSDYEGLAGVMVEALAAGLPSVATDCSVNMALLTGNGRFGQLVPTGGGAALAAAMRTAGDAVKTGVRADTQAMHALAATFTAEASVEALITVLRTAATPQNVAKMPY